ncbi:hypothetical protein SAMN05444128_3411 [Pontibacter indicus]|uniref:Uncharacterized protein n=1 Tax=Pontibacter indicus TaxID=1317125 RepID=A0A1R3XQ77_9BACT|nr:hypothetical protein SAMN05444128_3411 [Pontibacter indicus]
MNNITSYTQIRSIIPIKELVEHVDNSAHDYPGTVIMLDDLLDAWEKPELDHKKKMEKKKGGANLPFSLNKYMSFWHPIVSSSIELSTCGFLVLPTPLFKEESCSSSLTLISYIYYPLCLHWPRVSA